MRYGYSNLFGVGGTSGAVVGFVERILEKMGTVSCESALQHLTVMF